MKRIIVLSALCMLLVASLVLNLVLFRKAKSFYLQQQEVRLDPLGSRVHEDTLPGDTSERPLLVFAGDSRAASWPPSDGMPQYRSVNRAVGNQTTVQILGRLEEDVLCLKPDIVLLQAGVNDLKTIPLLPERKDQIVADCKTNLCRIVKACTEHGSTVIITTIFPVGKASLQRKPFWSSDVALAIDDVNSLLKSLAATNIIILDAHSRLIGDANRINPEYSEDLLHVNSAGYNRLNRELAGVLSAEDSPGP